MRDSELLDAFAAGGSQDAFGELVRRHIGTVFSAARRQVRDLAAADDITQAVFIVLARKAAGIDRAGPLGAWLLKTTHFACMDYRKRALRRQRHEQAAAVLAAQREKDMNCDTGDPAKTQAAITEELDAALATLGDRDRGAVTLRYLDGLSVADTAAAMSVTPAAAAKRIARAVERMRRCLLRRGVIVPAAAVAVALEHIPAFSPGAALAANVAAAATLSAAASAAGAAAGATGAAAGPGAIAKGTLQMMYWIRIKLAAVVLAGTAVAATAATGTVVLLQQPKGDAQPPRPVLVALAANPNEIPAPAKPAETQSFVVLANGVSIEVVGVGQNPSRGKPWWKADGSPLPKAPYSRLDGEVSSDPTQLLREVAVKINPVSHLSPDPAVLRWTVIGNGGSSSSDIHPPSPGVEATAFILVDDPAGCTVRANIAAGDWTTVHTFNGIFSQSSSSAGAFGFSRKAFLMSQAIDSHGKTYVTVACTGIGQDAPEVRMVVTDAAGAQHPAQSHGSIYDGSTILASFQTEVALDSIKQWDLQTRPFDQWIEIRHVALHPWQKTQVEVMTSDGG